MIRTCSKKSARSAPSSAETNQHMAHQPTRTYQSLHYFAPRYHQSCGIQSKSTRHFAQFFSRLNPSHRLLSAYQPRAPATNGGAPDRAELFPLKCVLPALTPMSPPAPRRTPSTLMPSENHLPIPVLSVAPKNFIGKRPRPKRSYALSVPAPSSPSPIPEYHRTVGPRTK